MPLFRSKYRKTAFTRSPAEENELAVRAAVPEVSAEGPRGSSAVFGTVSLSCLCWVERQRGERVGWQEERAVWGVGRKTEPTALWVSTDSGAAPRGRVRPAARLHPLLGAGAAAGVGGVAAQRPDVSATCPGPFVLGSLTRLSFLCRRPPSSSSHFFSHFK